MYIDSYEAEKLQKLIDELKTEFKNPKTPDFVKRKLQERIMFLKNDILPVIQRDTIIVHSEISKYAIRCYETAIKYKCNGLLAYIPISDNYKEHPIIGIANCKDNGINYNSGDMQIYCNRVEILNMDGGGVDNVECFTLPIHELL